MGNIISKKIQTKIDNNWEKLKCTEVGHLLQLLGIAQGDPTKTQNICKSSTFDNMFNSSILKFNKNFDLITVIVDGLNKQLNSMRKVVNGIRQQMFENLSKIATKIFMLYAMIANIFFILIKHIRNILNIMKYSINTGMGMFAIIGSLINIIRVPINKLLRTSGAFKKIGSKIKKFFKR